MKIILFSLARADVRTGVHACALVCGFFFSVEQLTAVYLLFSELSAFAQKLCFLVCVLFIVALLCDSPVIAVHTQSCFMLQALGTSHLKE